ncbi:AAA-ATPase [Gregarina niphandrodes]|uniref:AAA-ATPase n=1 Tax=Gregarina niphandrodes TaxID=110365 RepID=A0A023BAN3_GRENI|nr:AAA-ATPase [Gregarina niphandrodes]EZG78322.1 AAA-ATPase [Gregarina niphandrodes]|eukprot:XP_011129342.1 AAA-ATPase [Gregarina niphandrodes]
MTDRKLPLGAQNFEDLRTRGCVYVDKTDQVWKIANAGRPYVLSRPRRFGKSLLISTFKAYFQGQKDLFTGLAIESLETKWEQYPVLHLDLSAIEYYPDTSTPGEQVNMLEEAISDRLDEWEKQFAVPDDEGSLSDRFARIIQHTSQGWGKGAVVLIDESDKPLLEAPPSTYVLEHHLSLLDSFYSVLKREERHLRFVFLTGITKLAQVNVLGEIHRRNGSILDRDFPALCGFTREELTECFHHEIEILRVTNDSGNDRSIQDMLRALCRGYEDVLNALSRRYGGYRFHHLGKQLFHPWSVLMCFHEREFGDYSDQIGIFKILKGVVKDSDNDLSALLGGYALDGSDVHPTSATVFNPDVEPGSTNYLRSLRNVLEDPLTLTYHCGYLTIKDYDQHLDVYQLAFPNQLVKLGVAKFAISTRTRLSDKERKSLIRDLLAALDAGTLRSFFATFNSFFTSLHCRPESCMDHHYSLIINLVFCLVGEFTKTQLLSDGAEATVETSKRIYKFVFQLKETGEGSLEKSKTSVKKEREENSEEQNSEEENGEEENSEEENSEEDRSSTSAMGGTRTLVNVSVKVGRQTFDRFKTVQSYVVNDSHSDSTVENSVSDDASSSPL